MSLVQFQNSEVVAQNSQTTYNSNAGTFNLNFEISGSANSALDLNSIRLLANVDYLTGEGKHLNNNNIYRLAIRQGSGAFGVVKPTAAPTFQQETQPFVDVDCRTGANMCINSILWQDAKNNNLENVHSYPHLMNKITSLTTSQNDALTWMGHGFGISGGGNSLINQQSINSKKILSMKLYTGMTQSGPIPYSMASGRIKLSIQLNGSSSVFNGGENYGANFGQGTGNAALNGGCSYRLSNVKLIFRNLIFPEDAPQLKSYQYKHFSSLQNTINSSNNTNIYQPNSSNAISLLTSFIPSENLNNFSKNSVQSDKLQNSPADPAGIYPANVNSKVDIRQTNFLKNNQNYPLEFPIDETIYTQNFNGLNNYDVQRSFYYTSCIVPSNKLHNTLLNSSTENYGSFTEDTSPDFNVPVSSGVGIRYATIDSTSGTNFLNGQSFQQQITSGLNSSQNNEMFSNVMSSKSIVITGAGSVIIN